MIITLQLRLFPQAVQGRKPTEEHYRDILLALLPPWSHFRLILLCTLDGWEVWGTTAYPFPTFLVLSMNNSSHYFQFSDFKPLRVTIKGSHLPPPTPPTHTPHTPLARILKHFVTGVNIDHRPQVHNTLELHNFTSACSAVQTVSANWRGADKSL